MLDIVAKNNFPAGSNLDHCASYLLPSQLEGRLNAALLPMRRTIENSVKTIKYATRCTRRCLPNNVVKPMDCSVVVLMASHPSSSWSCYLYRWMPPFCLSVSLCLTVPTIITMEVLTLLSSLPRATKLASRKLETSGFEKFLCAMIFLPDANLLALPFLFFLLSLSFSLAIGNDYQVP